MLLGLFDCSQIYFCFQYFYAIFKEVILNSDAKNLILYQFFKDKGLYTSEIGR